MNYAKCICMFIKSSDGMFLDVILCNAVHYTMQGNIPRVGLWCHELIRCSGSWCSSCSLSHQKDNLDLLQVKFTHSFPTSLSCGLNSCSFFSKFSTDYSKSHEPVVCS